MIDPSILDIRYVTAARDGSKVVIVVYIEDWEEYEAHLWTDGAPQTDATYHTSNEQDAFDTAKRMVGR